MSKSKGTMWVRFILSWDKDKAIHHFIAHAIGAFITSIAQGYEDTQGFFPQANYDITDYRYLDESSNIDDSEAPTIIGLTLSIPKKRHKAVQGLTRYLNETFVTKLNDGYDFSWHSHGKVRLEIKEERLDI